jgi:LPS sulfotransferase NodH
LFAELAHRSGWCLPHEYFQPWEYLPMLADRLGCFTSGYVDRERYIARLCDARTYRTGWLGINIHGGHLDTFEQFEALLPDVDTLYVHIRRRDLIAQAVSYELAHQRGSWSSHFEHSAEPRYDFRKIRKRLDSIKQQELLIAKFLAKRDVSCDTVWYEDLAADPAAVMKALLPPGNDLPSLESPRLRRQAGAINSDWATRFAEDNDSADARR